MFNSLFQWVIQKMAGITAEQWRQIIEWVIMAVTKSEIGANKKAWVLDKMSEFNVKGSWANFLIESAVAYAKKKGLIAP